MYNINFYVDKNGNEPVRKYIDDLRKSSLGNKDSRIKFNKIDFYMQTLAAYGTRAGEPYVKHIEGELWELRPLRDRIFFFCWQGDKFILLHSFMKKTQKTPKREIEQAKRNMIDFMERLTIKSQA